MWMLLQLAPILSKSLEGRAFTWYTSLLLGSVLSWNDTATQFMKKFFTMDEKLTLLDLQQERQRISEGLLDYIYRGGKIIGYLHCWHVI